MNIYFSSTFNYSDGTQKGDGWRFPPSTPNLYAPLTWIDSATFTATLALRAVASGGAGSYDSNIYVLNGSLSSDGVTMSSLHVSHRESIVEYDNTGQLGYTSERNTGYQVTNAAGDTTNSTWVPIFDYLTNVNKIVSNVSDNVTSTEYPPFSGLPDPRTTVKAVTSVAWGIHDELQIQTTQN
ncbi:MAG: hypothetical protein ACHQM6_07425, partial [Candidatus Kapaibacterium sp.]